MSSQQTPAQALNSPQISLVVLLSGKGSNLKAILDAIAAGKLQAEIKGVISDKSQALGLNIAQEQGIPSFFIDPKAFDDRQSFDKALQEQIEQLECELVVLAGFMRILSDNFVNHFTGKLINIHPSLLPKYKGLKTHQRVLEDAETLHGCSVHFVSAELDDGPVIAQSQFNVSLEDDAVSLQDKVHQLEHQLYPQVIQWIAEKRVALVNGQVHKKSL